MQSFPKTTKFIFPWRTYQQRVLDELSEHLSDKHLHIVAPPGSGKTVLGLEVALRLNQPTLILAPTLAIRNQWIQRFCELFLQVEVIPDWISKDIRQPSFITAATYQGLHAAAQNYSNNEADQIEDDSQNGFDDELITIPSTHSAEKLQAIIKGLQAQGVKTIIVDEAHHLQNAWWQTLIQVKEALDATVIGLTATPPYDVSGKEWDRYISLNGPIDTEISVPELVKAGDLCPHQDYIYLSLPSTEEQADISEYHANLAKIFSKVSDNRELQQACLSHPAWLDSEQHLEWIYQYFDHFAAMLIFLNNANHDIPSTHLNIVGDKKVAIPAFDYVWAEKLLTFFLYSKDQHFSGFEKLQTTLENQLRRHGVIEYQKIGFNENKRITNTLKNSISKLTAINDIVDFEHSALGDDLRLVVLTDYIRKEYLVTDSSNDLVLSKIGAIPIFENLRREQSVADSRKLAVLTGSIVILPHSSQARLSSLATQKGISSLNSDPLAYDANYVLLQQSEQIKHVVVELITQLFQEGEITVLVGTKALLGEGWDAPAINALILASFVGSFVLSNQMRGRAIRTERGNPSKTSNIWHIASIDQHSLSGGEDLLLMERRFRTFVGVSARTSTESAQTDEQNSSAVIQNGISRMNLPPAKQLIGQFSVDKIIAGVNQETLAAAGDRQVLLNRWIEALESGDALIEGIQMPWHEDRPYSAETRVKFNRTIAYMASTTVSAYLTFGAESLQFLFSSLRNLKGVDHLLSYLSVLGWLGLAYFGFFTIRHAKLYLKHRDIAKDINNIAIALLQSLRKAGVISTPPPDPAVESTINRHGMVQCYLHNASTYEKSVFTNAMIEIIMPIKNPRYVITRKGSLFGFLSQTDYHAVPEILGQNKKLATYFLKQWQANVGKSALIYTRTLEGRKLLLTARAEALSAVFEDEAERVNKWQ